MSGIQFQRKILLGNGRRGVDQQRAKSKYGCNHRLTAKSPANLIDASTAVQKKRELSNFRRREEIQKMK